MNEQRKSGRGGQTSRTTTRKRSSGDYTRGNNTGSDRASEREREMEQKEDVEE